MGPKLGHKLKNIPGRPGVYIMKDAKDSVLYVGKAKHLRNRVKNYFGPLKDKRNSVLLFVPRIRDIEFIVTDNETEAFLLENTLIKKLKPRYNINLRDDKDFLCIRLDLKEDFPRMTFIRRPRNDGAVYFGPYSSGYAIKSTMKGVGKIFPLRRCSDHVFKNRSRPCILYQIGLCLAPCTGYVSKEAYREIVKGAVSFLKGNTRDVLCDLRIKMHKSSEETRYEDAASYRDRINALNDSMTEQKVIGDDFKNRDIFGFARNGEFVAVSVLPVREGRLIGGKNFKLKAKYLNDKEAFSSFLSQYYLNKATFTPGEILIPNLLKDKSLLGEAMKKNSQKLPKIIIPQKGSKKKLVDMAEENARQAIVEVQTEEEKVKKLLESCKSTLSLSSLPVRIEGYDISGIQGKHAVGSMVVFTNGISDKDLYRKFKIKGVNKPDDYSMLNEILTRRLSNQDLGPLPDLIVIDGGKGQLNVAAEILNEKSYDPINLVSIAKERTKKNKKQIDRIFLKGRKNALSLKANSPVLQLIGRVRDEAHRFALSYHRKLRDKVK